MEPSAPRSEILDTHAFEYDPPHGLSRVERWTCTKCYSAVLKNGSYLYGSATTDACTGGE